jgi:hypothetical protein
VPCFSCESWIDIIDEYYRELFHIIGVGVLFKYDEIREEMHSKITPDLD